MRKLLVLTAGVVLAGSTQATLLDFDTTAPQGSVLVISSGVDYGDNVVAAGGSSYTTTYQVGAEGATPNLDIDWYAGSTTYGVGYGDLTDVVYNSGGWFLTVTPDAGYQTKVHSLDLGHWDTGVQTATVNIYDTTASTILSTVNVSIASDGHATATFDYTAPVDERIWIRVIATGGSNQSLFAMDNLLISQIPEPATLSLFSRAGLGVILMRRITRN